MHTNFDEEIERFPKTPDWPLIIGCGFLVGFGVIMLLVIV